MLGSKAGYNIFAHSRSDEIGTPRLLPLHFKNILIGLSEKETAQILYPAFLRFVIRIKWFNSWMSEKIEN